MNNYRVYILYAGVQDIALDRCLIKKHKQIPRAPDTTRPNISQFQSSHIRRLTLLNVINCKMLGRVLAFIFLSNLIVAFEEHHFL